MSTTDNPLLTPVQYVKGVGPYLSDLLEKTGTRTVLDLLYYFPNRYIDRRQLCTTRTLTPGKNRSFVGEVVGLASRPLKNQRRRILEMLVKDQTGIVLVVWFHFNEKYFQKKYPTGKKIFISGECQFYREHKQFVHPDIEDWDEEAQEIKNPILPVYPLTEGLYQKTIRKIIKNALDNYLQYLEDSPFSVRATGDTKIGLQDSVRQIHFPGEESDIDRFNSQTSPWHQRVIYDELFFLQLGLALRKKDYEKELTYSIKPSEEILQKALSLIPFQLTKAQQKVITDITCDLKKDQPMNRLVQGDVGCGKTLVAFLTSLHVAKNGLQTAIMVPTEILASQHYKNLLPLAEKLDLRLVLLTGSTPQTQRNEILSDLKSGKIHIILGTHALIQEEVAFNRLGYMVVDEQHRFGVLQRAALKEKGKNRGSGIGDRNFSDHEPQAPNPKPRIPHILSMTATPIPRTLCMSLYGDLDISVIDELPKGRQPIKTYVYGEKSRTKAYELISKELKKGRQCYFIYPLIEESEKLDLKNATEMAKNLEEVFAHDKIGLLHGRMKNEEKETIMKNFKENKINILVSTTVVEVGVDVPNATVMVIEHAERFGLSQLHQLRGRVGRGGNQSYCLLIAGYARSEETRYRLKIMEETNDGFKIAEEDLKIRGPGDFLGTRQHGLPEFRLAHLMRDSKLLEVARKRAFEILEEDPHLQKELYQNLKKILAQRWEGRLELGNVS